MSDDNLEEYLERIRKVEPAHTKERARLYAHFAKVTDALCEARAYVEGTVFLNMDDETKLVLLWTSDTDDRLWTLTVVDDYVENDTPTRLTNCGLDTQHAAEKVMPKLVEIIAVNMERQSQP